MEIEIEFMQEEAKKQMDAWDLRDAKKRKLKVPIDMGAVISEDKPIQIEIAEPKRKVTKKTTPTEVNLNKKKNKNPLF